MTNTTNVPKVLDGIAIAAEIKAEVSVEVQRLKQQGIVPGLAVILVGEVPGLADLCAQQGEDLRRAGYLQRNADAA